MAELQFLDKYIETKLLSENEEQRKNHEPSGKLSAGKLGSPLQWAVLHVLGVPGKDLEEYVIRKFERGNHVEEWLVGQMPGLINKQKFVEYRDAVGFVDALVDMRDWNLDIGVIPHEVKSVTNANYKWIQRDGYKTPHALQGAFYALALGADKFALNYVATDDYRVTTYMLETKDFKDRIDKVIDDFKATIAEGEIPPFEPLEKWQENDKYNSYLEFKDLSPLQAKALLKTKYPESYKKLCNK